MEITVDDQEIQDILSKGSDWFMQWWSDNVNRAKEAIEKTPPSGGSGVTYDTGDFPRVSSAISPPQSITELSNDWMMDPPRGSVPLHVGLQPSPPPDPINFPNSADERLGESIPPRVERSRQKTEDLEVRVQTLERAVQYILSKQDVNGPYLAARDKMFLSEFKDDN